MLTREQLTARIEGARVQQESLSQKYSRLKKQAIRFEKQGKDKLANIAYNEATQALAQSRLTQHRIDAFYEVLNGEVILPSIKY